MANPLNKPLSESERLVVVADYYLRRYPTVEQAQAKMKANHAGLDDETIAKAMDEAVFALVAAKLAEEQYMEAHFGDFPELRRATEQLHEEIIGPLESGEQALPELPAKPDKQGGFADVIWTDENGNKRQVRVDFDAGTSLDAIVDESKQMAEDDSDKTVGHTVVYAEFEVLGVYYTR